MVNDDKVTEVDEEKETVVIDEKEENETIETIETIEEIEGSLLLGQDINLSEPTIFIIQLTVLLLFSMMILGFVIKKLLQFVKG